ncbi:hypothetical protein B0I37DRAFT_370420 [Chaetomium sp. MPI-CAGE-AT-0009]|nr:hypothetical protein B0I37DRAFT_370420 [Chaetomium sp. MPI-CAGE-AT-0009]
MPSHSLLMCCVIEFPAFARAYLPCLALPAVEMETQHQEGDATLEARWTKTGQYLGRAGRTSKACRTTGMRHDEMVSLNRRLRAARTVPCVVASTSYHSLEWRERDRRGGADGAFWSQNGVVGAGGGQDGRYHPAGYDRARILSSFCIVSRLSACLRLPPSFSHQPFRGLSGMEVNVALLRFNSQMTTNGGAVTDDRPRRN